MTHEIDARGLACPAPVLMAKSEIENAAPETLKILVDNEAAQQNIIRFLQSQQYEVVSAAQGSDFQIIGTKGQTTDAPEPVKPDAPQSETQKIMVMVTTDRLGHGDDGLGHKLMVNFINTLKEMGPDLWQLVFVNNGVRLAIDDSEVLPALKEYVQTGIQVWVCGTCLTHFDLLERKAVGEVTNMLDIVTAMQFSDQVITI